MKPTFKLLLHSTFLTMLSAIVFLTSCKDDEELKNYIQYAGETYAINKGNIQDNGVDNYTNNDADGDTHINYRFELTDGEFDENVFVLAKNANYALIVDLYAPIDDSNQSFTGGTFEYVDYSLIYIGDPSLKGNYVFSSSFPALWIENDNNGVVNDSDNAYLVTGGTITVTGSGANFTIVLDLQMAGGQTLKGDFSGTFTVTQG